MNKILLITLLFSITGCKYRKPVEHYPLSVPPILQEENPEIAKIFAPKETKENEQKSN